MTDPVILVGRRRGDPWRERLWGWCRDFWTRELGWEVVEGYHEDDGPFCLSVATNRAAERAGRWAVALLVGADWTVADPEQARCAVECARSTGKLWFAHDETVVLTEEATRELLSDGGNPADEEWREAAGSHHLNTFSGVQAIPRQLWDRVGGFDARFRSWGFDDLSFWMACSALGGYERVSGVSLHLWHPQVRALREDHPLYNENRALWERYRDVKTDPAGMAALLAESGGPLDR